MACALGRQIISNEADCFYHAKFFFFSVFNRRCRGKCFRITAATPPSFIDLKETILWPIYANAVVAMSCNKNNNSHVTRRKNINIWSHMFYDIKLMLSLSDLAHLFQKQLTFRTITRPSRTQKPEIGSVELQTFATF